MPDSETQEVRRWTPAAKADPKAPGYTCIEKADGGYVKYEDHLSHLEAVEAERDQWKAEAIATREARAKDAFEAVKDRITDELDKQAGASVALAVAVSLTSAAEDQKRSAEAQRDQYLGGLRERDARLEAIVDRCGRVEREQGPAAKEGLPNDIARAQGEVNVAQFIREGAEEELPDALASEDSTSSQAEEPKEALATVKRAVEVIDDWAAENADKSDREGDVSDERYKAFTLAASFIRSKLPLAISPSQGLVSDRGEAFSFEDWCAVDEAMAFASEYGSEERIDSERLGELRPIVQAALGQSAGRGGAGPEKRSSSDARGVREHPRTGVAQPPDTAMDRMPELAEKFRAAYYERTRQPLVGSVVRQTLREILADKETREPGEYDCSIEGRTRVEEEAVAEHLGWTLSGVRKRRKDSSVGQAFKDLGFGLTPEPSQDTPSRVSGLTVEADQ